MFGSLVVSLPSQFMGGSLVTRHNCQEVSYDWSSPADNPAQNIQWAAFYSDVEHEILKVTEGHRVTLTYNLYYDKYNNIIPTAVDVTTSPFYSHLKAALDHPYFLRDGGELGFACQHAYIFENFKYYRGERLSLLLKGSNRTILLAAKSLGLRVEVISIVQDELGDEYGNTKQYAHYSNSFEFENTNGFICYNGKSCVGQQEHWKNWTGYFAEEGIDDDSHITWCQTQSVQHQPALAAAHYGTEFTATICYQAAAILVTIPDWSERHDGIGPRDLESSGSTSGEESSDKIREKSKDA